MNGRSAEAGEEPKNWMEARALETGDVPEYQHQFDIYAQTLELMHLGDEAERLRKEYRE